jgi:maltose-binding protein MalE
MKKFLFISILCTVSILTLTGCNNNSNSEKENPSTNSEKSTKIISEMYTEEELQTAKDLITENISHWNYNVENLEVKYD